MPTGTKKKLGKYNKNTLQVYTKHIKKFGKILKDYKEIKQIHQHI